MPNFMIAYHGGRKPETKEAGMAHMQRWKAWVQGLGDAVVNPGTPLPASRIVTASGVQEDSDASGMNGFAIVRADSLEAAVEIARSDPFLEMDGTIRVSQMMDMP